MHANNTTSGAPVRVDRVDRAHLPRTHRVPTLDPLNARVLAYIRARQRRRRRRRAAQPGVGVGS
jgi:hypothetical protein